MAQYLSQAEVRERSLRLIRSMTGSMSNAEIVGRMAVYDITVDHLVQRLNNVGQSGMIGPTITRSYVFNLLGL